MKSNQQKDRYRKTNAKHWCNLCKVFVFNNKSCIARHEETNQHRAHLESQINISIATSQLKDRKGEGVGIRKRETPLYSFVPKAEKQQEQEKEGKIIDWKCTNASLNPVETDLNSTTASQPVSSDRQNIKVNMQLLDKKKKLFKAPTKLSVFEEEE